MEWNGDILVAIRVLEVTGFVIMFPTAASITV
jgi:hypothetical protein